MTLEVARWATQLSLSGNMIKQKTYKFYVNSQKNKSLDSGDPVFHHGWSGGRPMNLGLSAALLKTSYHQVSKPRVMSSGWADRSEIRMYVLRQHCCRGASPISDRRKYGILKLNLAASRLHEISRLVVYWRGPGSDINQWNTGRCWFAIF